MSDNDKVMVTLDTALHNIDAAIALMHAALTDAVHVADEMAIECGYYQAPLKEETRAVLAELEASTTEIKTDEV